MYVRNFMSSPVITLPSSTRAIDALELMQAKKIRRIPILEEGRLTGILTLGDIQAVLGLQEHSVRRATTKLGDIMTRKVHTVSADDPLERAARVMLDHEVSGLPVVEGEQVSGIITESTTVAPCFRRSDNALLKTRTTSVSVVAVRYACVRTPMRAPFNPSRRNDFE